jgi:hypothetical protein
VADLTFRDAIVQNLGRAVAAVAERVLGDLPAEAQGFLGQTLLDRSMTLIVSIRMTPFQVAVHAQVTDPTIADTTPPLLLCEIKGGDAEESYDNRN